MNLDRNIQQALLFQQQGRLDEARQAWKSILKRDGRNVPALANLASLLARAGRPDQARSLYVRALKLETGSAELWFNYGNLLNQEGRLEETERCYRKALKINENLPPVWYNLATLLKKKGQLDASASAFRQTLQRAPDLARVRCGYADLLVESGDAAGALEQYQLAQQKDPTEPLAYLGMGNVLADNRQYEDAIRAFEGGRIAEPGSERFLAPLAELYVLTGQEARAVECWQALLDAEPDNPRAHLGLGRLLFRIQDSPELVRLAVAHLQRATALDPGNLEAGLQLGFTLVDAGRASEAGQLAAKLLQRHSDEALPHMLKAYIAVQQARIADGLVSYDRALQRAPGHLTALTNQCFSALYSDSLSAQELTALHLRNGDAISAALSPRPAARCHERDGRRLRVGYLSADFRAHPVGYFLEPLLTHLDRDAFEVFGYHLQPRLDEHGQKLAGAIEHFRACAQLDDEALARQIEADELDILVDTCGLTADARVRVVAGRVAPVQATWLGYPCTTGLPSVDYCIGDPVLMPPGCEALYRERPARLTHPFLCYQPRPGTPGVQAAPSKINNFITFGSFNNYAKVSDACVEAWSALLGAVPNSRLLLKASAFQDTGTVDRARARFAAHGIDAQRLDFEGPTRPLQAFLAEYGRIDIALDPFPYNGGTTTCDALWMGVPVVSLAGAHFHQRMGASILGAVGREEWLAHDVDAYLEKGAALAADLGHLDAARTAMRLQMQQSPLCDAQGFAAAMMFLLHGMVDGKLA